MKDINQQEQQLSSGYPGLLSFRLPQLITFNLPNTSVRSRRSKQLLWCKSKIRDQHHMKRIIVVGNTATGKSTLAMTLAEANGLTYVDLDDLHFLPGWRWRPPQEFRALVDFATNGDRWAIAGNYIEYSSDISWPRADTLIWLDLPFWPNFLKLLQRTIERSWTGELVHNGNKESFFKEFCTSNSVFRWFLELREHDTKRLSLLFSNPDQYPNLRLIRLKSYREIDLFLESVRSTTTCLN
jgi:adenylate kinase family enzyme